MSLTLSNNNDRSGTYYYGDVITMTNSTPFTTIYLCIDDTYQTIIADYPDANSGTQYADSHGNIFYDYDACFFKYTVTMLIYGQSYYFKVTDGTNTVSSGTFIYSIANDLTTNALMYTKTDSLTITSSESFTELHLCQSVSTDTYPLYVGSSTNSFTISIEDINLPIIGNTFTLETGYYFVGTGYNERMSMPFLYYDITISPLKSSYYDGETVNFTGTYDLYSSSGFISSYTTSCTFSSLTNGDEYYFMSGSNKTPTFKYRSTSTSFYLTPEMDTFFNTDDSSNGQTHKVISSQFNSSFSSNKSLLVAFGGNGAGQSTSEAHCYFVTSIINQYMTKYMYYKSTSTLDDSESKAVLNSLLDLIVLSINYICELMCINSNSTSGQVFFPPWVSSINSDEELYVNGVVYSAQDTNQQLTCSLLRLWMFDQSYPYLNTYQCTDLMNTSEMKELSLSSTYDWNATDAIDLSDTYYLNTVLKTIIEKFIVDLLQSGNYKISTNTAFSTETGDETSSTSIEDYSFLDYVSFYLYILIQVYISSNTINNMTSLDTYYTPAIKRVIEWITTSSLPEIMNNSGDGPDAVFNRLSFQISELIEVYNNGDSVIGLPSNTVKTYFEFTDYHKVSSVMSALLSYEISYDGIYFDLTSTYYPKFYYIATGSGSTLTTSPSIISGYTRMITYLLAIENNIFMIYKRSDTSSSRYLENMTFTQLLTDTSDVPLNLSYAATEWSEKYTSSNDSDFSNLWMQYFSGNIRYCLDTNNAWTSSAVNGSGATKSWCTQNSSYFAWNMGTLHMSLYRMNRSIVN
jgi:hypothetical protein